MKKYVSLLLMLLVFTLTLPGCGSGETQQENDGNAADGTTVAARDGAGGETQQENDGNADLSDVKIIFTAVNLVYTDYPEVIKKSDANPDGTYTIGFVIKGHMEHDIVIDELNGGKPLIYGKGEGKYKATVNLEPGEYVFYCSIPGHRVAGMEGKIKIE